jgi:hypothetical protein
MRLTIHWRMRGWGAMATRARKASRSLASFFGFPCEGWCDLCVLCKRIYTVHRCPRVPSRFLTTSKHLAAFLSLRLVESPTLRNAAQSPQSLRALLQALVPHAEPSLQISWNSGYILKATGTGDVHSLIVHARALDGQESAHRATTPSSKFNYQAKSSKANQGHTSADGRSIRCRHNGSRSWLSVFFYQR